MSKSSEQKRVFITWAEQNTRSYSFAYHLEAKNYFIHSSSINKRFLAPLRYVINIFKTLSFLNREKPDVIFVANPPVFAVLVVWFYCIFHKSRFIVDTHSVAFTAKRWAMFLWLYRLLSRQSFLNILHNKPLEKRVASWRAPTATIEVIRIANRNRTYPFSQGFNVVFVSSYSPDEPLEDVIEAAKKIPSVNFYITGSLKRAPKEIVDEAPQNVRFTDFLPNEEYNALLEGSDIVICLTKNDFTMQGGAYEALSMGRPIITSNWPVLCDTFYKGAICINNTYSSLIGAINEIKNNYLQYVKEINELRSELHSNWQINLSYLLKLLDSLNVR